MWLAQKMKPAVPEAEADQGVSTIVGDEMGVVTRGEVRRLPVYGPGGYVWLPESGASVLVIKGGPGGEDGTLELRGRVDSRGSLSVNGESYKPCTCGEGEAL